MKAPSPKWLLIAGVLLAGMWCIGSLMDMPGRRTLVIQVRSDAEVCVPWADQSVQGRADRERLGMPELECGANQSGVVIRAGDCVAVRYDQETFAMEIASKVECAS